MKERRRGRDQHDGAAGLDEGAELALAVGAAAPRRPGRGSPRRARAGDRPAPRGRAARAPRACRRVAAPGRCRAGRPCRARRRRDEQVGVRCDLDRVLRDHDHRERVHELLVGAQPVDEQRQDVRLAATARGDQQRVGAVAAAGGRTRALEQLVENLPAPDRPPPEVLRVRGRRRERDEPRPPVYGRHRSQARRTISEPKRTCHRPGRRSGPARDDRGARRRPRPRRRRSRSPARVAARPQCTAPGR